MTQGILQHEADDATIYDIADVMVSGGVEQWVSSGKITITTIKFNAIGLDMMKTSGYDSYVELFSKPFHYNVYVPENRVTIKGCVFGETWQRSACGLDQPFVGGAVLIFTEID
jgi:hypothetical protein